MRKHKVSIEKYIYTEVNGNKRGKRKEERGKRKEREEINAVNPEGKKENIATQPRSNHLKSSKGPHTL